MIMPLTRILQSQPEIIPATLADYPLIENLWRFYVYDLGRYCGFNKDWECPTNLSFIQDDLSHYIVDENRKTFLVKMAEELAGFVLIYKGASHDVDWKIGEFFIISKFQNKGIGESVTNQLFNQFPGIWELTVLPENKLALHFWRKVISRYTGGNFSEEIKMVDYISPNPKRFFFRFNSEQKTKSVPAEIRQALPSDIQGMVALSDHKRREYEKAQPHFWRRSKNANDIQAEWFKKLLSDENHILLVAEYEHSIKGFIIGELKSAPGVYDPKGLTLMIDDFCVENCDWNCIGNPLLHTLQQQAKQKGAVQTLVVCGHHDELKRDFLRTEGLEIASDWFVGDIGNCGG